MYFLPLLPFPQPLTHFLSVVAKRALGSGSQQPRTCSLGYGHGSSTSRMKKETSLLGLSPERCHCSSFPSWRQSPLPRGLWCHLAQAGLRTLITCDRLKVSGQCPVSFQQAQDPPEKPSPLALTTSVNTEMHPNAPTQLSACKNQAHTTPEGLHQASLWNQGKYRDLKLSSHFCTRRSKTLYVIKT